MTTIALSFIKLSTMKHHPLSLKLFNFTSMTIKDTIMCCYVVLGKLVPIMLLKLSNVLWSKPEPNILKILLIIPSSTSQKIYPLFLFYSHIITYYSHVILYALLLQVLTCIHRNMDLIHILLQLVCRLQWCLYVYIKWKGRWKSTLPFLKLHHLLFHYFSLIFDI